MRGGRGRGAGRGAKPFDPDFAMGDNVVATKSVQAMLQAAAKSGTLRLANRDMPSLPAELFNLQELDYQDKQWWMEQELHTLDVSHNRLDHLPSDVVSFAMSLRTLNASYNVIANIFADLSAFTLLVKLDLSHNRLQGELNAALSASSGGVACLRELKECDLSHNSLTGASGFAWLPNLTILTLSHNQLTAFESEPPPPGAVTAYRVLQTLDISNNKLAQLPGIFGAARALQSLDASCNRLGQIDAAALSPALVTLNVRQNALTTLPEPLLCPKLRDLIIGANRFTALPDLTAATEISFLDASNNRLTSIERATQLKCLARLDLQNNDLATLPPRLALIKPLTSVVLDGNPLRSIRRDIVARGTMELLKYLRTRLSERDNDDLMPSTDAVLEEVAQRGSGGPSPTAAGAGGGHVNTGITVLGERNGATWDLSTATSSAPMLPETLDMSLISNAAPTTLQVVPGSTSLSLAGQRKLRRIDSEVLVMLGPGLSEVDASGSAVDSLDWVLAMPLALGGVPCPPNLRTLKVQGARLSGPFRDEWCTGRSLTHLDLSRNVITDLADPLFANMNSLAHINLNHNRIGRFPVVLLRLPSLLELHMSSNGLADMPEGVHQAWPRLQVLDVSYNELQTVPLTLGLMSNTLRMVKLEGNRMRWLRQTVLDKGTGKVLEFLRERLPPA